MADSRLAPVLRYLHRLADPRVTEELPDSALLGRLATRRDPLALETLLRRHGPLVWRVCRRVLHHEHDAEDAFQATFLALARQASSIRKPESLASFLHGTAYRIARRVREDAQRRHAAERNSTSLPVAEDPTQEAAWRKLGRILEEEVSALPERLRLALLLSYWEGLSNEETARRLGWPCGTVKTRLAKARKLLHERLTRRGVTLPAGGAVLLLAESAGNAAVPPTLAAATITAANPHMAGASPRVAALAQEGLTQLMSAKVKIGLVLLLAVATAAAGMGALVRHAPVAEEPPTVAKGEDRSTPAKEHRPEHVDLQGDLLPEGAVARLGTVRFRMGGLVYACAYSPDGKTLAAGSADNTVTLFDAATGKPIRRLQGHYHHVTSLAFAPDGRTLAAGNPDATFSILEVATGKLLREFHTPAFPSHMDPVWSLTFTPDGRGLISGGGNSPIVFWDPATGKEVRRFTVPQKEDIRCVVLSPDGRTIASAGDAIRLWDTATGKMIRRFEGQKGPIRSLAFSPDGKLLASGGEANPAIWLWETATGEVRRRLPDDPKELKKLWYSRARSLAFSPDGKTLVVGDGDYSLRFWDVAAGKKLREIPGIGGRTTYRSYHDGGIQCIVFSRDGKKLVLGRDNELTLLDTQTGKEVLPLQAHQSAVRRLFFSPDGKRLLTTSDDPARMVVEWDATSGRLIRPLPGKAVQAHGMAFSPDRTIMVSTGNGTALHLWDTTSGKEIRRIPLPIKVSHTPGDVVFSPDGKLLAVVAAEWEAVWLFDSATGKQVCTVEDMGSPGRIASLAFSPDGRLLAAAAYGTIHVAEVPSGRKLRRIALPKNSQTLTVAVSPDGRTVATPITGFINAGRMTLWETATGEERLVLPAPAGTLRCAAFSPDGRLLTAGGYDSTVFVWEVIAGKGMSRLEGHRSEIESVAFSPDSRRLASGSLDTTALIWDVSRLGRKQRPHAALPPKKLDELWTSLAGDAAKAYQAILTLESVPDQAVPLLAERFRLEDKPDAERMKRLLSQLDSEIFAERERATEQLRKLGLAAEPALRMLLQSKPSVEARKRATELLDSTRQQELRLLRGVEVLERIGSPKAKQVIRALAENAPSSCLARDAKASLNRLSSD